MPRRTLFGFLFSYPMKVIINNQEKEIKASSLEELRKELQLPERGVAMAIDSRMVPQKEWAVTMLKEADKVTIIKAAFGG